jgi:thiol-disulfide isomerase/thioredoxin
MRRNLAVAPLWVAAFLLLFLGCKGKTEAPPGSLGGGPSAASGEAPPAGEAPEGFALMDAAAFDVHDYKGRVLILDFWATWCGPCKMEIPHLIELQEKYGDQGLTVIGITVDESPDKDVPPYAAEVGMNYTNVRANDAFMSRYGVFALPTLVIYDRDGNQVMKRPGYIEKDQLEGIIKPLLTPPSS